MSCLGSRPGNTKLRAVFCDGVFYHRTRKVQPAIAGHPTACTNNPFAPLVTGVRHTELFQYIQGGRVNLRHVMVGQWLVSSTAHAGRGGIRRRRRIGIRPGSSAIAFSWFVLFRHRFGYSGLQALEARSRFSTIPAASLSQVSPVTPSFRSWDFSILPVAFCGSCSTIRI